MSAILFFALAAMVHAGEAAAEGSATYRCWSFNVDGGGGRCPSGSPIILHPDGTYQESSVRGRYAVKGDEIVFSKSTVRGPGRIKDRTIVFNYETAGHRYTVTYLFASGSPPGATDASATGSSAGTPPSSDTSAGRADKRVSVDLTI